MNLEEQIITEEPEITPVPAEEAPVEEAPVEEIPVEEAPAAEIPAEEAAVEEAPVAEPVEEPIPEPAAEEAPKKKHKRKKPPIGLRILLQFLSFVLSVVLFVTVLAGVLVADLRQITSEGGIKKLINALLTVESAPVAVEPLRVEAGPKLDDETTSTLPEDVTIPEDITVGEDGSVVIGDVSVNIGDIPDDILSGGGGESNVMNLVDWIYDSIASSTENEMKFSKTELQQFVQESTVADYVSEKLAGFAEDIINGTENTAITADELVNLLKENENLMQDKLNVEMSQEQWNQIENTMDQMVAESAINETIRESVYETVDAVLEENSEALGGLKREDIQQMLQTLTSDSLFFTFVGVSLGLVVLLCLLNYYNIPAGLTWAGLPTTFVGLIMAVPLMVLGGSADVVTQMMPELASVTGVLAGFVNVFAVIHYGLLGIGIFLLVASIVWRIVRIFIRKRRA